MFNTNFRTKAPRALITVPEFTFKCAYSVLAYETILGYLMNCNQSITIHFPDGSAVVFHGYVRSFIPDEVSEGAQPEATITIVPTMWDHVFCVESAFLIYYETGTCWQDCHPGIADTFRAS